MSETHVIPEPMTGPDLQRLLTGTPVTQTMVAEELGISSGNLSKWLSRQEELPHLFVRRFLQARKDAATKLARRALEVAA